MALPLALSLLAVGSPAAMPLRQGDPAPFEGQLLDNDTAARLVAAADYARHRAGILVQEAQAQTTVETQRADALGAMVEKRAIDLKGCDEALGQCRTLLDQRRSNFATGWIWGSLGLFAGAAVGALTMGMLSAR
jgi:hypothetical protein